MWGSPQLWAAASSSTYYQGTRYRIVSIISPAASTFPEMLGIPWYNIVSLNIKMQTTTKSLWCLFVTFLILYVEQYDNITKLEAKIESLESERDYLLEELIKSSKESNGCSTFEKVEYCFTTVYGAISSIAGGGLGACFPGSSSFVYRVVEFIINIGSPKIF